MSDDLRSRFTDENVKQVLQRAIELDALEKSTVSEADLRSLAQEVGVSPTAMERAIQEHRHPEVITATGAPGVLPVRAWRGMIPGAALGAGAGVVMTIALSAQGGHPPFGLFFPVLGLGLIGGAAALAAREARNSEHLPYQARNFAALLGFAGGVVLASRLFPTGFPFAGLYLLRLGIQAWFVASVAGASVIHVRGGSSNTNAAPPSAPSSQGGGAGEARPHRSKWREVIDRLLSRFQTVGASATT